MSIRDEAIECISQFQVAMSDKNLKITKKL